jgi:hypothetical protein
MMKRIYLLATIGLLAACGGDQQKDKAAVPADHSAAATTAATGKESSAAATDTLIGKIAYVCPPCQCSMHDTVFYHAGVCPACHMPLVRKQ